MKKKNTRRLLLILAACAAAACQGCTASQPPRIFGDSYRAVLAAQTLNPDGPADKTPVASCPGSVGELIYEKYKETLGGKTAQSFFRSSL